MFSAIRRAFSLDRGVPKRGCHISMVRSIRWLLSALIAFDVFTEDLTVGFSPFRASDLRPRNPTDNAGSYIIFIFGVPIPGIAI
jgi:hypothetical protein